jgi:hypothetical protein
MHRFLTRHRSPWLCILLAGCFLLSGCATTSQGQVDQVGGTIAGAAFGALMGGLIGGSAESALIGAAAGGLVGWTAATVAHYEANQVRTAREDRKMYGFNKGVSSPTVKIRQATVTPERVATGNEVVIVTDYSVYLPNGSRSVPVEEHYVLTKDGKEVRKFPPQNKTYAEGGWTGKAGIPIPRSAKPGTYVIEHRISAGSSYDVTTTTFIVGS